LLPALLGTAAAWSSYRRSRQNSCLRQVLIRSRPVWASYNPPGGNATGINFQTADMEAKRLGLLHELMPHAKTVAFVYNPKYAAAEGQLHDVREAARTLGLQINVLHASTDNEINAAFRAMVQEQTAALILAADPFFDTPRNQLVVLAAYKMLPAIYQFRGADLRVRLHGVCKLARRLPHIHRRIYKKWAKVIKFAGAKIN
jgi:hypothetical protein